MSENEAPGAKSRYEAILQAVRQWAPPKRNTLEKALGLLATDQPAPSDEKVQRWLDEHRIGRIC